MDLRDFEVSKRYTERWYRLAVLETIIFTWVNLGNGLFVMEINVLEENTR